MANEDRMMAKIKCNIVNTDFLDFRQKYFDMENNLTNKGF